MKGWLYVKIYILTHDVKTRCRARQASLHRSELIVYLSYKTNWSLINECKGTGKFPWKKKIESSVISYTAQKMR